MAQTPEKKVKNKVAALLKKYNIYYFFPTTFGMGRSGVPDILCCAKGHFLGIECKAGENKPTVLQLKELADITDAGGTAIVVNESNLDELETLLKELSI